MSPHVGLLLPLAVSGPSGIGWTVAAGLAVAIACAALSPVIVSRRWAFVGEGVSHSGFGGAGVIWLLAVLLPQITWLRSAEATSLGVVVGALAVALGVGRLTRTAGHTSGVVGFDAAVGIFLTASLAVGFLARSVFEHQFGAIPARADALLFGADTAISMQDALLTLVICAAVVAGLRLFAREILAYAFDPALAELGGVRVGAVHYGLLIAVAATLASGARVVGAVLVTALLILPGATAAVLSRRLYVTWLISAAVAILAVGGALLVAQAGFGTLRLPMGPVVVLLLAVEFGIALLWARLTRAAPGRS